MKMKKELVGPTLGPNLAHALVVLILLATWFIERISKYLNLNYDNETCDKSDDDEGQFEHESRHGLLGRDKDSPLLLHTYQITEANLQQVIEVMGLEDATKVTNDIGADIEIFNQMQIGRCKCQFPCG